MKCTILLFAILLGGTCASVAALDGASAALASSPSSPGEWSTKDTVLAAAAIFGIAAAALSQYQNFRKGLAREIDLERVSKDEETRASKMPQPFEVRMPVEFATKAQLGELRAEVGEEIEKLSQQNRVETIRLAGDIAELKVMERTRTGDLHRRLDEITTRFGPMEGKLDEISGSLSEIRQFMMSKGGSK